MLLEEEHPMLPEEERPTAETEVPNGPPTETSSELVTLGPPTETPSELVTPIDRDELAAKFELLAARAKAAGISPFQVLAQTYVKRGMAVLEGILSALEDAPKKTPADTGKKG